MSEENKIKNVYQKLQTARVKLQNETLKKSGYNKFSNYGYFELSDFLPAINEIFEEVGLCSVITFTKDQAVMTVYNSENTSEQIQFTSPSSDVTLKGCHPIQNIGAVQTYQRRYLYMTALEIVEADVLDSSKKLSDIEVKLLYTTVKAEGIDNNDLNKVVQAKIKKDINNLSKDEYNLILNLLEHNIQSIKDWLNSKKQIA